MEGLLVLEQFVESWRNHPGFHVDSFGNASFQGMVEVQCDPVRHRCATLVRLWCYGHESGTVRLRKEPALLAAFPHAKFSLHRDTYKFRGADHALMIFGHSDRLDRKFVVAILPADPAYSGST